MAKQIAYNRSGFFTFIIGGHETVTVKTRTCCLCVLQLYYDTQSGAVLHETGQHIRLLLEKAKGLTIRFRLQKKKLTQMK
jgi:hypothetical protein